MAESQSYRSQTLSFGISFRSRTEGFFELHSTAYDLIRAALV